MSVNKFSEEKDIIYQIAKVEDANGIHEALLQNLIDFNDFKDISKYNIEDIENRGFLRKDVSTESFINLIKDESILIYVAKKKNVIIGFASIHRNKYDVREFRSTLQNLYIENERVRTLLTCKDTRFVYLNQVSIYPEYQGKGIGKKLFKMIITDNKTPIVSFIVKKPFVNNASVKWHEHLGFAMEATCDGKYKEKHFEWWIYIHWNS